MPETITRPDYDSLKKCAQCGHDPIIQEMTAAMFPWRIKCGNNVCGMSTPYQKLITIAFTVWNRRTKVRKAAKPCKKRMA